MNLGTSQVIRANSRHLPLVDDSVDLVVTSPPYFTLRSYQDGGEHYAGQIGDEPTPAEFIDSLIEVTAECVRVLKPSGSIWVNLGDKYAADSGGAHGPRQKSLIGLPWRYAIRCIDDLGLILRAEVIWHKPNGLPESAGDRVRRAHETWFHFTTEPKYHADLDAVREPYEWTYSKDYRQGGNTGTRENRDSTVLGDPRRTVGSHRVVQRAANPLGKLPGSVWRVPVEPLKVPQSLGVDHFAAFPMELPRRIIRGWSPEGGTVLDPFGGTGTTALVAKAWGRNGITVDMSSDYCRLAEWRTNDLDQLATAMQVDKPTKQVEGQSDLFDMLAG